MDGGGEARAAGRWFARGGLGWVNMVESAVADGLTPSEDALADMRTVSRRLADLLTRIDGKGVGAVPTPDSPRPLGAAGRRKGTQ